MNFNHHSQSCGCKKPCNCKGPVKEIVYPVKENVVHCCTEETIKHVHPSHTTVVNHHLVKNEHVFPHSTSYENTYDEVSNYGNEGSFGMGPGNVGGSSHPGMGCNKPKHGQKHCHKPHRPKWF